MSKLVCKSLSSKRVDSSDEGNSQLNAAVQASVVKIHMEKQSSLHQLVMQI